MKRKFITVALVMALLGGVSTSCIGSFALSNKLLSWNKSVSSKFVNEVVFIAFWIVPVYEVSMLADVLVINSIEFWSGSNPVSASKKVVDGENGRYIVESDDKGYKVSTEDGLMSMRLNYDDSDRSWSVETADGQEYTLFNYVDDTHVTVPTADGKTMEVELSADGLMAYRQMVNLEQDKTFWAAR